MYHLLMSDSAKRLSHSFFCNSYSFRLHIQQEFIDFRTFGHWLHLSFRKIIDIFRNNSFSFKASSLQCCFSIFFILYESDQYQTASMFKRRFISKRYLTRIGLIVAMFYWLTRKSHFPIFSNVPSCSLKSGIGTLAR